MSSTAVSGGLPDVRFVRQFEHDGETYYAMQRDHTIAVYRVVGTSDVVRTFVLHDAVIYGGAIVEPSYEHRYRTVDLYHHMAGRKASLRVDRTLDEPRVLLEEVTA